MAKTASRNDAYTGLLAISFLSLVAASALLALDMNALGDAPAPLQINVGSSIGKAGDPLKKLDAGAPVGGPAGKDGMGRGEPAKLPEIGLVNVPNPVVPASTVTTTPVEAPKPADGNEPPVPVKRFEIPQ